MRSQLDAWLLYTAPSELLVGRPVTLHTQKLLGSYLSQHPGTRAEYVAADGDGAEDAAAALVDFYEGAGPGPGASVPATSYMMESNALSASGRVHGEEQEGCTRSF